MEEYALVYMENNGSVRLEIKLLKHVVDRNSILLRGDYEFLSKSKKQLNQECFVGISDNEQCLTSLTQGETPWIVSRTVAVTSSGRSKYSLSPEYSEPDPYADPDFSDDDYQPAADEISTDSDPEMSYFDVPQSPTYASQRTNTVKRRLFEGEREQFPSSSFHQDIPHKASLDSTIVTSERISKQTESAASNKKSVETMAQISLNAERDVMVTLLQPIHHGVYNVALFRTYETVRDTCDTMRGYLRKTDLPPGHQCKPFIPGKHDIIYTVRRKNNQIELKFEVCCPEGSAFGKERTLEEQGQEVAFLKYSPPDVIDEFDYTPTKGTKLKQHYCRFCKTLKTCIGAHFQRKHSNEPEVESLLRLSPNSKRKALRKLRHESDKIYNTTISPSRRITGRRPIVALISSNVHCPHCKGLFVKKHFSRHERKCAPLPSYRRRRNLESLEAIRNVDDKLLESIFSRMKSDEVGEVARSDETIKLLVFDILSNKKSEQQLKTCRSQMRLCARLLLAMRKLDESVVDFKDCFSPSKYRTLCQAICLICSKDPEEGLTHHSLALTCGPLLSKAAKRIHIQMIEKHNFPDSHPDILSIENFLKVHDANFKCYVSRMALQGKKHLLKKKIQLPKSADVVKLIKFLKQTSDNSYQSLKINGFTEDAWTSLGKSLLCELLIYNRRRVGEMSRALLSDYMDKRKVIDSDRKHLTRLQNMLATYFEVMYITGKRDRILPVLLKSYIVEQLDLFIEMRSLAGVPEDNIYLFGYPNVDGHLNASAVLRDFSTQCGADIPDLLRSTKLRQQLATMCQILNLNDNELHQIADFMGHDFEVHLRHYRMNEMTSQVTQISRFLSAVGRTDVHKHKNKTLEELAYVSGDEESDDSESHTADSEPSSGILAETLIEELDQGGFHPSTITSDEHFEVATEDIPVTQPIPSTITSDEHFEVATEDIPVTQPIPSTYFADESLESHETVCKSVTTPRRNIKQKKKCPRKSPHKSPSTKELLQTLTDPRVRIETRQTRKKWSESEVRLMEKTFHDELIKKKRLERKKCIEFFKKHKNQLCNRTVHSVYMWIKNRLENMI